MNTPDLRALCEQIVADHEWRESEKKFFATECLALLDENEKMRGALEWYADKSHYDNLEHLKGPHLPAIDQDYGQIARRALNKLGERT